MGIPFECDLCHFRNLNRRDPEHGDARDDWTLLCIRRAILDAFWSRETSTVRGNLNRLKLDYQSAMSTFSMACPLPTLGSDEVEDKVGMSGALIMLNASLRQGKNVASHLQADSTRKTVSWLNNVYGASSWASSEMVLSNQDTTFHVVKGPVTSRWRERNSQGVRRRMGMQRKQNEPLTMAVMLAILDMAEKDWQKSTSQAERKEVEETMCYMIIGFMLSLRGEEVPMTDLKGLLEYWEETFDLPVAERHVMITLRGMFKGEDQMRYHCLPIADLSRSRVPSRLWLSRMLSRQYKAGRRSGYFFVKGKRRARILGYDPTFRAYLTRVKARHPKLFLKNVKIEDYSLWRSLGRGATISQMINQTPGLVIDEINRWRSKKNAKSLEAGLPLRQVYASVRYTMPLKIQYSRNH